MKLMRRNLRQHVSKQLMVPVLTFERGTLGTSVYSGVLAIDPPEDFKQTLERFWVRATELRASHLKQIGQIN